MEKIDPNEIKEIQSERWQEWSTMFTNTNQGRIINLEIKDEESSTKTLADNLELIAVDYDPVGKGNNFVISFGSRQSPSRHRIDNPVKITQMQNKIGLVASIIIEDTMGIRSIILFK